MGRLDLSAGESFDVIIDDNSIRTGSVSTLASSTARTWYDGISYAKVVETDATGIADHEIHPEGFRLSQNYPNPFNPVTTISFSVPYRSYVRLVLVNLLGKEVMNIADGMFQPGEHHIRLNASSLASGVYFYKMEAGKFHKVLKMIIAK